MHGLELGVRAEPAAGEIERGELAGEQLLGLVCCTGVLYDDGGGGADGPEGARRQHGLHEIGRLSHREVPPDVTVGGLELVIGLEDAPVLPVVPESELLVLLLDVEDEDPPSDAAVVRAEPAPGRSWATTTPMATVAPAEAAIAHRVSARSRDFALSLSAGVLE